MYQPRGNSEWSKVLEVACEIGFGRFDSVQKSWSNTAFSRPLLLKFSYEVRDLIRNGKRLWVELGFCY
jgi:hypothetical protein